MKLVKWCLKIINLIGGGLENSDVIKKTPHECSGNVPYFFEFLDGFCYRITLNNNLYTIRPWVYNWPRTNNLFHFIAFSSISPPT